MTAVTPRARFPKRKASDSGCIIYLSKTPLVMNRRRFSILKLKVAQAMHRTISDARRQHLAIRQPNQRL